MKTWTKPSIISLMAKSINSGVKAMGAERIVTCSGSILPASLVAYKTVDCLGPGISSGYDCANISTLSGQFFISSSAADVIAATGPCS